ncbi:hypothetical protein [Streptomyces sp. NPDC059010]|uniref:AMP-binding enzyme n=1 Tax=Streptomyces sp. NPDC059010 TaxID=3346695 RepID=UPI0036B7F61E
MGCGGIWASPHEVENRLLQHPDVAAACVVAVPDTDGLDRPVACVVPASTDPRDPLDTDALTAFCRQTLASYTCPRRILTFTALPTTGTGKVNRRQVQQQALGRLTAGTPAHGPLPGET